MTAAIIGVNELTVYLVLVSRYVYVRGTINFKLGIVQEMRFTIGVVRFR